MTDANDPIPQITRDDEAAGSGNMVAGNIARLKALFPEIVTDGKVDFDVLRELLGDAVEEGEERYGLNWKGKRKARAFALTPSLGTLLPAPEVSVDWDTTQNLMIEGDNLEALKLLRRSYAGKIKMIYIDPPYNTGTDFVYTDNYKRPLDNYLSITGQSGSDGELLVSDRDSAGRFHTDWLNMIYPRLSLAKEFLRDDGIILVNIDDSEIANLYEIMIEIFGEENSIGALVYERNRKNDAKYFSIGHEYLLCFFRSETRVSELETRFRGLKDGVDELKEVFEKSRSAHGDDWDQVKEDLLEFYRSIPDDDARQPLTRFRKVDARGPYRDDGNINWPGGGGPRYEILHPGTGKAVKLPVSGWRYPTPDRFWEEVEKGRVVFGPDETTVPRVRTNIFENREQVMTSVHFSYAQNSTNELISLFDGARVFDNPKGISDITKLIEYVTDREDIVMDFFAGSGTTAHAVMRQNALDDGSRRYVLVQIPEVVEASKDKQSAAAEFLEAAGLPLNIAELTKERLRRAGAKIREEHPDAKVDTGFRVYKLATSNLKPWQPDAEDLEASILDAVDNVLPGRTEEDLLVELLLKTGIDLTLPEEKRTIAGQTVHALGGGTLMVCLGNIGADDAEALGQGMADWVDELDPVQTTVYFKDTGLGADGNRAATKANLAAILRQRLGDRIAKIASI